MVSRKRRRATTETPIIWTLPEDLLLEIAVRSGLRAFIRFAATCKLLLRDLLSASFVRSISHTDVAPCILAYVSTDDDNLFTLVHPVNPVTASLCHDHLFPFFSRHVVDLFDQYRVKTSRRGLVLLECFRRPVYMKIQSNSDLCVYDPMSGAQTFLSYPPVIKSSSTQSHHKYLLLTAADGIDCSYLLLVIHFSAWGIRWQTASSSSCEKWGSVTYVSNHKFSWWSVKSQRDPAVLHGGVMHWLMSHDKPIASYHLVTRKIDLVKLPPINCKVDQLHLTTSSDGKLLKLLAIEGFMMSVWLQIPISPAGGSGWSMETVIDMEEKLRSLHPDIPPSGPLDPIVFVESQSRSGEVVLLQVPTPGYYDNPYIVLDLETKDMHRQVCGSSLLEIDLPSRLHNMKSFS